MVADTIPFLSEGPRCNGSERIAMTLSIQCAYRYNKNNGKRQQSRNAILKVMFAALTFAIIENITTFSVKMNFMTVSGTLNLHLIAIFALIDVQLVYIQGQCFSE